MQFTHRLLSAAALAAASACSFAGTVTYTSASAFLAQVAPGAYTETFTGLPSSAPGETSMTFTQGLYTYTASSPGGFYLGGDYLGAGQIETAITLTFGDYIYAVGGNFFTTDINDALQALSLTLTLDDGTTATFTPTTLGTSYRGFTSDVAIRSLTITAPVGDGLYRGLDNLTVGTAVPEPAGLALVSLALAGLAAARRRVA